MFDPDRDKCPVCRSALHQIASSAMAVVVVDAQARAGPLTIDGCATNGQRVYVLGPEKPRRRT